MLWGKRMESIYCKAEVLGDNDLKSYNKSIKSSKSKIKDVMINFNKERDICRALKMLKDYQGAFYKFYRIPILH